MFEMLMSPTLYGNLEHNRVFLVGTVIKKDITIWEKQPYFMMYDICNWLSANYRMIPFNQFGVLMVQLLEHCAANFLVVSSNTTDTGLYGLFP